MQEEEQRQQRSSRQHDFQHEIRAEFPDPSTQSSQNTRGYPHFRLPLALDGSNPPSLHHTVDRGNSEIDIHFYLAAKATYILGAIARRDPARAGFDRSVAFLPGVPVVEASAHGSLSRVCGPLVKVDLSHVPTSVLDVGLSVLAISE